MKDTVLVFSDLEAMSQAAAAAIAQAAAEAVETHNSVSIVLSGGSTPRRLYELFRTEWRDRIPWTRTHLFWSDERFVPVDHPESNFGAALELFIRHVPIPTTHVHNIPTEGGDHHVAAAAYESTLRAHFEDRGAPGFDLALLGIGVDGHTASLFPGGPIDSDRWVEPVDGPAYRPPVERITLTLTALSVSRKVLFLASGSEKRPIIERILRGEDDLPAAKVCPRDERVWMIDRAAGAPLIPLRPWK